MISGRRASPQTSLSQSDRTTTTVFRHGRRLVTGHPQGNKFHLEKRRSGRWREVFLFEVGGASPGSSSPEDPWVGGCPSWDVGGGVAAEDVCVRGVRGLWAYVDSPLETPRPGREEGRHLSGTPPFRYCRCKRKGDSTPTHLPPVPDRRPDTVYVQGF